MRCDPGEAPVGGILRKGNIMNCLLCGEMFEAFKNGASQKFCSFNCRHFYHDKYVIVKWVCMNTTAWETLSDGVLRRVRIGE